MLDIVGKRYWYFALSLLVIIPGLIFMIIHLAQTGSILPLSIDFRGGTLLTTVFTEQKNVAPGEAKTLLIDKAGLPADTSVTTFNQGGLFGLQIRTEAIDQARRAEIEKILSDQYGTIDPGKGEFQSVGASVGREVTQSATFAVLAASLFILVYIWFAFRHMPNPFRYGVCAIIAMLHDVFVVLGTAAIFGVLFGWQVDSLFLTALLTVIGFSVHDTIVVFDRIRENLLRHRTEKFETVVNHSIIQTMDRSINTQLTVMFTLLALALFGGASIRHFVITLLIGLISGTYSSIFNASPLLVVWENHEVGNFLRRLFGRGQPATVSTR